MRRPGISWRVRGDVMRTSWSRHHDAYLCNYCLKELSAYDVVIDHIMPVALGGGNEFENLQVTCRRCNQWKSDMHPDVAEEYINDKLDALYEGGQK